MSTKRLFITLTGLLLCLNTFGQTETLRTIDLELTSCFKTMIAADAKLRYDSLAPAFKKQLREQLKNPLTFNNQLDSLSKYLSVVTSSDGKVKFYSWDGVSGGNWHDINCMAQFTSKKGALSVQQLNTEKSAETGDFTDSGIYQVYELTTDTTTFYLTFAYGTHGSGNHHRIIRMFYISNNQLLQCDSCLAGLRELALEHPRSEKANLSFNAKTKEISFREFEVNPQHEINRPTGRTVKLVWNKGVFKQH